MSLVFAVPRFSIFFCALHCALLQIQLTSGISSVNAIAVSRLKNVISRGKTRVLSEEFICGNALGSRDVGAVVQAICVVVVSVCRVIGDGTRCRWKQ